MFGVAGAGRPFRISIRSPEIRDFWKRYDQTAPQAERGTSHLKGAALTPSFLDR